MDCKSHTIALYPVCLSKSLYILQVLLILRTTTCLLACCWSVMSLNTCHIVSIGFDEKLQYNYLHMLLAQCLAGDSTSVVLNLVTIPHSLCKLGAPTPLPCGDQMCVQSLSYFAWGANNIIVYICPGTWQMFKSLQSSHWHVSGVSGPQVLDLIPFMLYLSSVLCDLIMCTVVVVFTEIVVSAGLAGLSVSLGCSSCWLGV